MVGPCNFPIDEFTTTVKIKDSNMNSVPITPLIEVSDLSVNVGTRNGPIAKKTYQYSLSCWSETEVYLNKALGMLDKYDSQQIGEWAQFSDSEGPIFNSFNHPSILRVSPPQQDNPNDYNLHVRVCPHGSESEDVTVNSVHYSANVNCKIVFAIDISGSMNEELPLIKRQIKKIFVGHIPPVIDYVGPDIKLITFTDEIETVTDDFIDTSTLSGKESFKEQIDSVQALRGSGGDYFEGQFTTLDFVLNDINFGENAKKIIFLFTDSPSHYEGDGTGVCDISKETLIQSLNDGDFTVFIAGIECRQYTGEDALSTATGGKFYHITNLDLWDALSSLPD